MVTIQEELAALEKALKECPTSLHIDQAKNLRKMATTPEDEAAIDEFVSRHLNDIENVISEMEKDVLRLQLGEVLDIVNISYIAEKYFGRSRSWLSQRINGCIVNGKKESFTDKEIQTLKHALKDIANIINSCLARIS